jgi:ubiquinone/menaquinone biosynthesis C-methylase UbiE
MTHKPDQNESRDSYVLQDNPAINRMLQRRGAKEARCILPVLEKQQGDTSIVDLGCGVGTITAFIARSAMELCDGEVAVWGIDQDRNSLAQARGHIEQLGLTNVHFLEGDIHNFPESIAPASVDIFYLNAVLMYSPNPLKVFSEMMRSLKPGGTVVARDLEPGGGVWYPSHPLRTKWVELFERSIAHMGGTPGVSLQLHTYAADSGYINIEPFGENNRLYDAALQEFAAQMAGLVHGGLGKQWIASGWCTEEEAEAIADAWDSLPNESGAMLGHLWGGITAKKPG